MRKLRTLSMFCLILYQFGLALTIYSFVPILENLNLFLSNSFSTLLITIHFILASFLILVIISLDIIILVKGYSFWEDQWIKKEA